MSSCVVNPVPSRQPLQLISNVNKHHQPTSKESLPSAKPTAFKRVLETDPGEIAALWERVRPLKADTMPPKRSQGQSVPPKRESTRQSKRLKGAEPKELNDTVSVPFDDALDSEPDDAAAEPILTKPSRISHVTARSPGFEELALKPRKILIIRGEVEGNTNPHSHFGTTKPSSGNPIDYKAIEGLDAAEIWLSFTDESVRRIINTYKFLTSKNVCEPEYASFATETFLRPQPRDLETPSDRKWRAERMIQLVAPPQPLSKWIPPISFAENGFDFNFFDIRPDCAYWLSLAGFNENYRSELEESVYVYEEWITCPYFTIEFKKHGQSIEQAQCQAAAAASMALYNRYQLKSKALQVLESEWTDDDRAQMRHYVLTFAGSQYGIWVLRAQFENDMWNGCTMKPVHISRCTAPSGVQKLEKWINEIHRWGLSEHATGCRDDVKTILKSKDVEVSMAG